MLDFLLGLWRINRLKAYACQPFVCPNCGEHFFVKWYKLWIYRDHTITLCGKAKLRCPKCREVDMCRWTGEPL